MYIITVLPLKVIYPAHTEVALTYFARTRPPIGAVIEIPIRKKTARAIVVAVIPATSAKLSLKTASYVPKKIDIPERPFVLSEALVSAARTIAARSISQTGAVIGTMLLAKLLPEEPAARGANATAPEEHVVVGPYTSRIAYIRELIAKAHAPVWIFTPTHIRADALARALESNNPCVLHSARGKKQLHAVMTRAQHAPSVIISTPAGLGYLSGNEHIVIESAENTHWVRSERPLIDMRLLIREVALRIRLSVSWCAAYPSLRLPEDLPKPLALPTTKTAVQWIDMKKETEARGAWTEISSALTAALRETPERAILYVSRKGYAPTLMCADCGTPVRCAKCSHVTSLTATGERQLRCPHCHAQSSAEIRCVQCDSWNIKGYGVGIERICEMLRAQFPNRLILRFDGDTAPTTARAREILAEFAVADRAILVGTDLILEYPDLTAPLAAIVHMDNVFTHTDYETPDHIYGTTLELMERCSTLMIQSHLMEDRIWKHVAERTGDAFFAEEREGRTFAALPPFTHLLRITAPAPGERASRMITRFVDILRELGIATTLEEQSAVHPQRWDITVARSDWDAHAERIADVTQKFPPDWSLVINPPRNL